MFELTEKQRRSALLALFWLFVGVVANPIFTGAYRMVINPSLYDAIEKGETARVQGCCAGALIPTIIIGV